MSRRLGVSALALCALLSFADKSVRLVQATESAPVRPAPLELLNHALGQLIYGVHDDDAGVSSSLRGHSLARSLFGANDQALNVEPFNGTGRLHFDHAAGLFAASSVDDHRLVNYQLFDGDPVRDPERYGTRAGTSAPRPYFTGGFNAPYSYPDANNMFLAAVRSDGSILAPSFHRSSIFGPLDSSNPNWWAPEGRYLLLRPRPVEMGPGFPGSDPSGDVKQLVAGPERSDSIWMDLGFPVRTGADGRKFKPLFAFLIVDLDSRIDVRTEGRSFDVGPNASRSGWGPWEVSVEYVPMSDDARASAGRPALSPWLWDRESESFYDVPNDDPAAPPSGPAVPFPGFDRRGDPRGDPGLPVPAFSDLRTPGRTPQDPETDWRGFRALALVAQGVDGRVGNLPGGDLAHALEAALRDRVDLARNLRDYSQSADPGRRSESGDFSAAQADRQRFAEEIYRNLLLVCGVAPVPDDRAHRPSEADLGPRRWLAQLAVNIVDYIDEDEVATTFHFYSAALDGLAPEEVGAGRSTAAGELLPRYWVFGTELPRVVLNEVMAEVQEADGRSMFRVWAELFAPPRDVGRPDHRSEPHHTQPLPLFAESSSGDGYSVYQVVLAAPSGIANPISLDDVDNGLGVPDGVRGVTAFPPSLGTLGNPNGRVPARVDTDHFVLVGPDSNGGQDAERTLGTVPGPASIRWLRSGAMEFTCDPDGALSTSDGVRCNRPVTVLLRRLANPNLPPDPRPAADGAVNHAYNPYVTVDYLERVSPADPSSLPTRAVGKLQPYASHADRVLPQTVAQGAGTFHTLGAPNEPRQPPDWLVHLDRAPTSPVELLQVSAYRPHQLTQRFLTTPHDERADFAHRAPWFDEDLTGSGASHDGPSHRLYRLLEYVRVDRGARRGHGGTWLPDEVNLNTIYDREVFVRLVRASSPETLGADRLEEMWLRFLGLRSPGLLGPEPTLTAFDRPFQSASVGHLPSTDPRANGRSIGIEDTFYRAWDPTSPDRARRLFDLPDADHPYLRKELLSRLHDRITVRSNVFAVWITTGFFEVVDDRTRPPRLGSEIGSPSGDVRRHRFFAIVDRSQLQLFGAQERRGALQTTRFLTRSDEHSGFVPGPGSHWVRLESISGLTSTERRDPAGATTGELLGWTIEPGTHLWVDRGRNREGVLVTGVERAGNAIQATFQRRHEPGFEVSIAGNPGPQEDFDARATRFRDVIRFAVAIR